MMQRAEANLLETLAENPKAIISQLAERCQAAQYALYTQMHIQDESGVPSHRGNRGGPVFVARGRSPRR